MAKTRIITLMFHRVNDQTSTLSANQFSQYLAYLVKHFPIVVPGDPLPATPYAICLTFDDAYYDFYHHVYPLLKLHQIKALLAVPVKYIIEKTDLSSHSRLSIPYPQGMESPIYEQKVPFCTWQELREMAKSNRVLMASHGFAHANLADKKTNILEEIEYSKRKLEHELAIPIRHFVYPYGKMNLRVHKVVCQHYDYGIRIGSALNIGWEHRNHFIYRIDAEQLYTDNKPISKRLIFKSTVKYWANRIRQV